MDINQIIIGAFENAKTNPEVFAEGYGNPGHGTQKKHNTKVPGSGENKKHNTKVPVTENLKTNLDTKRIEKEKEAAPLALAAGMGSLALRKRMKGLKKSTITTKL